MSFDYDSFYKELEKKKKEEEQKKQEQAAKKAAATTTPKTDAASESTEVTKTEDFYNSFFDELEKKQAMSPEELKKQADERDKEMLRANAEKMGAEKKGRTWFKKSETENNKSQYVDTGVWLNYTSGLSKEIRNGIYASNKKRIEEIDKQIASTFAGQESFWGALNPFDGGNPFNDSLKWGRSNNANKILREERDMLVGANAHYDKYGDAIDLSYEELKKKQEIAKQSGDTEAEMLYLSFANQKVYERISQELSKISYGKGATMLDKMAEIASMEDGKEKKKQIKEFEKALADKGYDFDKIYSNITGDYNMSADAFFNWLWASTNKGVAEFSSGVANTADTLLGNDFVKWLLGEENPISLATSQMREQTNKELAYLTFNQNLYKAQAGGGKGMEIAGNVISGAVAAVPDAIMAYWTGGLSTLNAPSKAVQNASYQLGNTFTKAGITATNMANNPLYWTSFIREYGSNYEEAKSKGASDLTAYFGATITSLVNAGIEIGLDGTSGIQGLTHDILDGNKSKLLSWIESSLEEGGEEMLQSFVSNATTKLLYDSDQELIQPKEMLEEGLTGAAVGGALGGGQIMLQGGVNQYNRVQNHIAERRLTESEQTVVDKTTEKRIAEKESKGVKLTEKLKKDVREQVFQQMKNGDLSVEEIEEALGGKAYTNYTQAVEGRKALDAEYESLLKKKEGDFTRGDTLRFEELTKAKNYDVVGKAREALDKTLGGVKGTRLEESYRERARRGEDFAFDASSVDSKLRDTYKRAAESGILNNTRKTHQLVDFIARISSDKGVSFDFTNNEKLKASGFAVEGRTVNGYVTSDGKTIGINVQSPKALNSVVGHEITHILEGTELYDSFAKLMEEYANTKGEYSSRFEAAKKLYEGKKGYEENLEVKVKKEVIADLAGDYLFTDSKFVEHLLNTDRNVFQRIWDEVKYLYKMATAGTPEAKKLEQVKHTFEKVYRQKGQKNTTREGGGVRYAISTDINGDQFVDVENTIISETDTAKDIADILSDIVENKYGEFVNVSSQKIGINKTTAREWQKSKNAQYLLNTDIGTYTDKMNAFSNADELLTVSKNYIGEKVKHIRKDNFVEFARGEINFKVGQNGYSADIIVGTTKSGVAVLYDIVNLQNKKIEVASNATQNRRTETPSAYSISENGENVKRKAAQFEIILQNNPATDSYHTWIRSARDIKTFEETLSDEDWSDGSDFDPDYTWDMAQKALTSGEITVYSSYPIEAGVFVTPSAMEARSYSGDGRIYSKTVKLTDVAWIDPTQGMFAQVKEGARYSLSEQFYNEYDDWDKTNPRKVFTIGNTSEVLKSLGVKDSEIKWDASKIIKIKANHPEMTDGIIKQVPDIIENPIVVFKSLQNESRLTLFGEVYANGKPILAVLELDPTGRNGASLDEIKIASAYGKDNAQNFINRSEALYIDSNRKRISDWEKRTGLQLPVGLPITDSIDSISENSGNVNSKLSLSDSDIAPTKYGDYNVYGEEVAKPEASEDIAPIRQDIAPAKKQAEQISFDEAVSVMEYIAAAGESNSFKNRLKNWDGKTTGFSFVIGRPSKALQNAGIPNKQIRMDASKIKTILAQHEAMDIDTISQIPDLLNNPVVVIDSKQNENARIVMGDLHDKNGKTVTAVLLLTPTSRNGNVLNVIKVSSAQGRGHIASLFKNDDGSSVNVRYTDKKRIQAWLNANRLQLPLHNLSLDSEAESHIGISANESIPQFAPTVNNGTAVSGDIAPVSEDTDIVTDSEDVREAEAQSESGEDYPTRRKAFHAQIVEDIKRTFSENGFDFDEVLKKAKNLSTFATVDNTPQRVMEKALGYKEGGILSDITVNKVAQNETEGIRWLNSYTDRKSGILAQLSKKYKIKPGSKQSAAAQMYAEGFYVDENNDIIRYGDAELAKDFPNAEEQARIKGLATDPTIRQIYDDTLDRINRSRTRNVYDAIPRLDNYFLHFRAMNDTFSRLGVPFNPNDIRAKDLPTDLNGVTADLKPGQPYFASANHRYGVRTDFDILGGLERYLTSAKNQIYHIDDIQILRALRNYIADTFGQANGLGNLDALSDAEAEERIRQVYSSHLSTFAKFLNEEANVLAGKTALIDRGLEGIIGRRGMAFLNTVNGQVGSNMVGFNLSSSLTNFLPIVQTFAKSKKTAFVKAFGQTVANRIGKLFGRGDSFANDSPVMIRREGADRFYRTPWQKAGDAGYVLMSTVDSISTELIARTKYNEFVKKGMTSEQAHYETDKWVSRLMADRSLGQTPQIYNSKMLGIITKFQLEVRNQLDAQFYDTIQEAKLSNEYIKNCLLRNAKTAAKVTSTFVQLAIVQNLFGKAFESIAGYNPAFDIIEVIATAVGWDDDESEDTVLDNIEQAFFDLLEDLPYTSTLTGGRIPMASALPLTELIKGVDKYGNDKSRWKTAAEALPYYILPGGYGQIKKTAQGLVMFDDDLSVSGSYTDSGKLRFPVEDTLESMFKAGLFGQWANENAREYFDEGRSALTEKQTQEFVDSGMSIHDYWEYREGLKGLGSVSEKFDYIDSLDISDEQKNLLINNLVDRKTPVNISNYGDYSSYEEFSFATDNPGKYQIARAVGGYEKFSTYRTTLNGIKAGNDTKTQRFAYIDGLKINEEYKWILKKMCYESYDDHNSDIVKYVNSLKMTAAEKKLLLDELGL